MEHDLIEDGAKEIEEPSHEMNEATQKLAIQILIANSFFSLSV